MKNFINHNKSILIAAAMLASLSGCAVIPEQTHLEYSSQQGIVKIPEANKVSVGVNVNDNRKNKNVSSVKNGLGMETASITAKEDVAITVRHAIEQELKSRGFELGTDATVNITADLSNFYSDFKVGFASGKAVADLNMVVAVKSKNGEMLYSKQLAAQGVKSMNMFNTLTQSNAKIALDQALANAMKTLFNDKAFIAALLASTTAN